MRRTVRLYEDDPYAMAFDAEVVESLTAKGRPAAVLDRTCFFPTSGGQPHDLGHLNHVPVVDVFELDGDIVHVLDGPLDSKHVRGCVDWPRRRDHMQQHTGQHILSQAFLRVCGAPTVGFHLGEQVSTIDLAVTDLPAELVRRAVDEANDVVISDRPVGVTTHNDPSSLPEGLRKEPTVDQAIRVVTVADYDISACCGTHVRRTGEIGAIHVARWERTKRQIRVTFLCGGRAVADHWAKMDLCRELTNLLSCGVDDLVSLVGKALDDRKAAEKRASALQEQLAAAEAYRLRAGAEPVGAVWLVCHLYDEMTADALRQLAREVVTDGEALVAVLATRTPSPIVCAACSHDAGLRADDLLRAALVPYGGRGGGSATVAQGGGVSQDRLSEVLAAVRQRCGMG